jgi:hypothetical protein
MERNVDESRRTVAEISRRLSLMTQVERMGGFGFIVWDVEANDVRLSEGIYAIFGLRHLTATAQPDFARAGGAIFDNLNRIVRPDGEIRHVHARARRVESDHDHPAIMLGTIVDVAPADTTGV